MRTIRSFLVTVFLLVTFLTKKTFSEPLDQVIRGYPCVKKMNHLECVQPGPSYPRQNIDSYIEENRATIRRMFGEISQPEALPISSHQKILNDSASYNKANRIARSNHLNLNQDNKIDSCESSVEIITPYWAANSGGKIRAIVNTQHLQQAIQQEICRKTQTKRCNNDCGCEQKYKWHRLLAYDPDDNCKGIFMDWFLFPSSCVCRCSNIFSEDH